MFLYLLESIYSSNFIAILFRYVEMLNSNVKNIAFSRLRPDLKTLATSSMKFARYERLRNFRTFFFIEIEFCKMGMKFGKVLLKCFSALFHL